MDIKINMKIKEKIEEQKISLEDLEKMTNIKVDYLKDIVELPADEILLSEAIAIADALNLDLKDLYEITCENKK